MTYQVGDELYRFIHDPNEIILIVRLSESRRLVKTIHIADHANSGWRGLDDIRRNWIPLTKDNK